MSFLKYDGSLALETPVPSSWQSSSSLGNDTLTGGSGPDGLSAEGPNALLIGNGGGDTFYIKASGVRVQATAGAAANQLFAYANTKLGDYANIQNLDVGGVAYGAGNAGDNIISASGSHQQLYGGGGEDVLVGDGQSDTFIVVKGEGDDAIYNFNPATDVVRLTAGYTSFAQLQAHMTQVGADVNVDLGGGSGLVLRNLTTSELSAANFQLQLDPTKIGAVTFHDEFDSLDLWNGASGTWATTFRFLDPNGNGGTLTSNGEAQWYINANYAGTAQVKPWTVGDGALTLTAAPAAADVQSAINGYKYTSGELNTAHAFAQTYGYFEIRAELPQTAGAWPAFWLMPTDGSWPPELDVMEALTRDPNAAYVTSHSNATGGHTYSQGMAFVPDTTDGFHTYGVLWTRTDLTWYIDGVEVFHTATPADMGKPMYMIVNLALGGWGGDINDGQLPAQMKVDYIRAYALADGSATVSLDTAHTGGGLYGASLLVGQNLTAPAGGGSLAGGSAADTLTGAETGPNYIRGNDGDDSIVGGAGGFNNINGNKGDDVIVGRSRTGDWLLGGQGNDSIDASQSRGDNIVNGNLGSDTLRGGSGADTLRGGQGDDLILGGAGNDWISGDRGSDTVTGGAGSDRFHVASGAGVTTVTDFNLAEGDRVELDHASQYTVTQVAGNVVVDVAGGGELVLQNVQRSSLDGADWIVVT
jgi:beta-glucanase (GH16 family)